MEPETLHPILPCCDLPVIIAFVLYLAAMLAIGVAAWKRTRNLEDYILGGRSLGSWVAALSAGASDMSGWLLLGLPGFAYAAGLESLWLAGGLLLGTWLNWRIVAPRLREATLSTGALTLPEFFAKRFSECSTLLRMVSAVFIIIFFTIYTCSGMVAGGKLFNAVFGIPYSMAVGTGAMAIIAYTFLGGFLAVSWTDAVQATLMFLALIIVPVAVFSGFGGEASEAGAFPAHFMNPLVNDDGTTITLISALSLAAWGAGYFGQPHILARFMAVDNKKNVAKARLIATSWAAITLAGATAAGIAGMMHLGPGLQDSEKVFIILVHRVMPPAVAGVCLSAVLAAIMSTADSQLLVSASVFTEDFYRVVLRKKAGRKELLNAGRLAVIAIAVAACVLALDPKSGVLDLVSYAWAGFGAAFGPVVVLALYWKNMTGPGAVAGILAGGITVLIWKNLHGGIFELYEIIPGIVFASMAIVLISALNGPRKPAGKMY